MTLRQITLARDEALRELQSAKKAFVEAQLAVVRARYNFELVDNDFYSEKLEAQSASPWINNLTEKRWAKTLPVVGTTNCDEIRKIPITILK